MSSVLAGGGGGGSGMGGSGSGSTGGNSGFCMYTCSTIFSALGVVAALLDFDLDPQSATSAIEGVSIVCYTKCQYQMRARQSNSNQGQNQNQQMQQQIQNNNEWNMQMDDAQSQWNNNLEFKEYKKLNSKIEQRNDAWDLPLEKLLDVQTEKIHEDNNHSHLNQPQKLMALKILKKIG